MSMNAMSVQRSASSMYGVATNTVLPARCSPAMMRQNSRRDTGSTPVVGSSSSSRSGSFMSVEASMSFCFMPPESLSASRSPNCAIPICSSSRGARSARQLAGYPAQAREVLEVLGDGEVGIHREALRHVADARLDRVGRRNHRFAEDERVALARHLHGREHRDERGLAGTVGAEQPEDGASADLERHGVDRDQVAEALGERLGRDGERGVARGGVGAGVTSRSSP